MQTKENNALKSFVNQDLGVKIRVGIKNADKKAREIILATNARSPRVVFINQIAAK